MFKYKLLKWLNIFCIIVSAIIFSLPAYGAVGLDLSAHFALKFKNDLDLTKLNESSSDYWKSKQEGPLIIGGDVFLSPPASFI